MSLTIKGVFAGAVIGAFTNAINGAISPYYFEKILKWEGISNVWRTSIKQGIFEGLMFGSILSVLFSTVVGLVSRASCPYSISVKFLLGIIGSALTFWLIGGFVGIGLSLLSPEFFQKTFYSLHPRQSR